MLKRLLQSLLAGIGTSTKDQDADTQGQASVPSPDRESASTSDPVATSEPVSKGDSDSGGDPASGSASPSGSDPASGNDTASAVDATDSVPDSPAAPTGPAAGTQNAKALSYYQRAQGAKLQGGCPGVSVVPLLRKAVEEDPRFGQAWLELAEQASIWSLYHEGGEDAKSAADEASEALLAIEPESAASFQAQGFTFMANQRFEAAALAFKAALVRNPALPGVHRFLARTEVFRGNLENARREFRLAADTDPADWESLPILAGLLEGNGEMEEAVRVAREGLARIEQQVELAPNNPRCLYLGALCLSRLNDRERTIQWAERAHGVAEADAPTRYNLACVFVKLGEIERALDFLEDSIDSVEWIRNDPDLRSLRDHPRMIAFLARLEGQGAA